MAREHSSYWTDCDLHSSSLPCRHSLAAFYRSVFITSRSFATEKSLDRQKSITFCSACLNPSATPESWPRSCRNREDTVPVPMQQVSGPNFHSAHLDTVADIEDVGIGMGNGDTSREELNTHSPHRRQFSNRAIGQVSDATQGLQNGSMHIAHESASARAACPCLPTPECGARESRECCSRNRHGHGSCRPP